MFQLIRAEVVPQWPQWHRQCRFLQMAQCRPASICRNLQWGGGSYRTDLPTSFTKSTLTINTNHTHHHLKRIKCPQVSPCVYYILELMYFDILGPNNFDILGRDILTCLLSGAYFDEIFPHNGSVWVGWAKTYGQGPG